jgi:hypothetical protein
MQLREQIAVLLSAEYNGPASVHLDAADAILSIPELKEALAHYSAAQSALENLGEFTIKKGA